MSFADELQNIQNKMHLEQEYEISINTNGALSNESTPDGLFYYRFSEDEIKAFYNVFENFKSYFKTQADKRHADRLYEELLPLMKKMEERSVEVMLYSSRIITNIIESNKNVMNVLVELVEKFLYSNETVRYISAGWEWSTQIRILVEACGRINYSEYIDTLMENYTSIVKLFPDNQSEIIGSYLNMILTSQNDKSIEYLVKIIRSNAMMNNPSNYKLLKNPIFNSDFMKSENNREKVINGIMESPVPSKYRYELNKYISKKYNDTFEGYVFGTKTYSTLKAFERVKDPETIKIGINKFIENIDNIPNKDVKSQVYYTLGSKASVTKDNNCKNQVREFLNKQIENDNTYFVGIKLGLLFLDVNNSNKVEVKNYLKPVFEQILRNDSSSDIKTLSTFFRFRKDIFSIFLDFMSDCMSMYNEQYKISDFLEILSDICNSYSDNFSRENYTAPQIIEILKFTADENINRSTMRNSLGIIDILIEYSPKMHKNILKLLGNMKNKLTTGEDNLAWIRDIDKRIKEIDKIAPPEG